MNHNPPAEIQIRGSERITFKRCQLKWYWEWKKGLVPRAKAFGALDLGTWVHETLARWYSSPKRQPGQLITHFADVSGAAVAMCIAQGDISEEVLAKADELAALGLGMMHHYGQVYGTDKELDIIAVEVPLEFTFDLTESWLGESGRPIRVTHKLKPDAVFRRRNFDGVLLLETKTATTIRTEHIAIDDQARPYMAMVERALVDQGIINKREKVVGIMYNHLRKALPPNKEISAQGLVLNKDGSPSKRQPPPFFARKIFPMSARAKAHVLLRLQREVRKIAATTLLLRRHPGTWDLLDKTPHHTCPRYCNFFAMCALHDEGADIRDMQRSMFTRRNPYVYDEETTDEVPTFEMG